MTNYSIVKIGNEYVVQANEKSILKVASRRMAAQLVATADCSRVPSVDPR